MPRKQTAVKRADEPGELADVISDTQAEMETLRPYEAFRKAIAEGKGVKAASKAAQDEMRRLLTPTPPRG